MKIAILSFYSGHVNRGAETFVHELSSQLAPKIDLTVFQSGPALKNSAYQVKTINQSTNFACPDPTTSLPRYLFLDYYSRQIAKFTRQALNQLKSAPPDILIALNNGWMSLLAKKFCQQQATKLILAGLSGIGWDDKLNLKLKPDTFICFTRHQADWAKTINPNAKLKLIHIGVNTLRFKPQGKKYEHKLRPPVVLSIAGPQAHKRTDLVIKAVSRLSHASLLLVGQQRPQINQLAKGLLGARYKNIKVDYQKMGSVYRSCDLFTLPSASHEAYGISILEALASNLPVIVNRDPIRQELVNKAGITLDPTNVPLYAQAIKTALAKNYHHQPRQQALKFSWPKISQQYLQLFNSLCR